MAEWLFEEGVGEDRAILVENGIILEAAIELPGALRAGDVVPARLIHLSASRRRGVALLESGEETIVEPLPAGLTEGAAFNAEIVREPIPELGRPKLARARPSDSMPGRGPPLEARIGQCTKPARVGADPFEEAGWSELLEQAASGEIPFPGGALRMSLTPAMTLFDVDGDLPPAELAKAGAAAAASTIRRLAIGGSIGVDLPTLAERSARQAAAAAVDALLPRPFERTAVNGFGFLQIVRRRLRPSIPELLRSDPLGSAARALVRRAERCQGHGPISLNAHPSVIARLDQEPSWLDGLRTRLGTALVLQGRPELAISAGHVQRQSH